MRGPGSRRETPHNSSLDLIMFLTAHSFIEVSLRATYGGKNKTFGQDENAGNLSSRQTKSSERAALLK